MCSMGVRTDSPYSMPRNTYDMFSVNDGAADNSAVDIIQAAIYQRGEAWGCIKVANEANPAGV